MQEKSNHQKLTTFIWSGKNSSGQICNGKLSATNIRFAKAQLQDQNIEVIKIYRKNKIFAFSLSFHKRDKIKRNDITLFLRQLATLLNSGITLLQALKTICLGVENVSMQNLLTSIIDEIRGGSSFAKTLFRHKEYFDNLTCQFIANGESSGNLPIMLQRISDHHEKLQVLRGKITKALIYPAAVVIMSIVVTAVLLLTVVPQFIELFANFNAPLPLSTRLVIYASEILKTYWWLIILIHTIIILIFMSLKKQSKKFRYLCDRCVLKSPVFGKLLRNNIISRVTRTLATSYTSGTPLLDGLSSVATIANNLLFHDAIMSIHNSIQNGQTLHAAIKSITLFPKLVVQLVAIGEEAGKLDDMLNKIADFYEEEVSKTVDTLNQLLEPFIMVVLGTIIGGLVISMYLPVFKLGMVI